MTTDLPAGRSSLSAPNLWLCLTLWLTITVGFMLYRTGDFFAWDDSPSVMATPVVVKGTDRVGWKDVWEFNELRRTQLRENPREFLWRLTSAAFDHIGKTGYRPLSSLQADFATLMVGGRGPTWIHLLIWGAGYGAFGLTLFLVARRFLHSDYSALLAVVLAIASPPCAAASAVVVAGFQVLVPTLICLSLLLYWRITESAGRPVFSILALATLMFAGPWFREFLGIVPLLIGVLELVRRRRPTLLMGMAAVFFLHAVFPTALVKFCVFPELPLAPVTRFGLVGSQMASNPLRWYAGWHFLPLFPPSLLLASALAMFLRRRQLGVTGNRWIRAAGQLQAWLPALWIFTVIVSGCFLPDQLPFVLCLGVAVLGLQQDFVLCAWFMLCFLPMLRVFTEHVHFLYAIVPASIILVGALETCWDFLKSLDHTKWRACAQLRWAVPALALFGATDQSLNLYASREVVRAQYAGMRQVAAHLEKVLPPDAVVVGNFIHLDEIKWLAGSTFRARFTIANGIMDPARHVTPQQFRGLMANAEKQPVYLLDCDFEHFADKAKHHKHPYIHYSTLKSADLGVVQATHVRYPFLDPLRHCLCAQHVPFLGPPDLENDFFRGRTKELTPFLFDMHATYRLYRAEVAEFDVYSPNSIQRVEEVGGFNILTDGTNFFAIPQGEGAFDVRKIISGGYNGALVGRSLADLKEKIASRRVVDPQSTLVRLLKTGVHGFNVVSFNDKVYGIPQTEGQFDIQKFEQNKYTRAFVGATLAAVETEIRKQVVDAPILFATGYWGFNLVSYKDRFYGISQGDGAFDEGRVSRNEYRNLLQGASAGEVQRKAITARLLDVFMRRIGLIPVGVVVAIGIWILRRRINGPSSQAKSSSPIHHDAAHSHPQ